MIANDLNWTGVAESRPASDILLFGVVHAREEITDFVFPAFSSGKFKRSDISRIIVRPVDIYQDFLRQIFFRDVFLEGFDDFETASINVFKVDICLNQMIRWSKFDTPTPVSSIAAKG